MSTALDELGWTKVFVDIRSTLPYVPIPQIGYIWGVNSLSYPFKPGTSKSGEVDYCLKVEELDSLSQTTSSSLPQKNQRNILQSRDVANAFSFPDNVLSFPIGHNMMVAASSSKMSTFVFKGGRPLMDKLGKELVDEILSWN